MSPNIVRESCQWNYENERHQASSIIHKVKITIWKIIFHFISSYMESESWSIYENNISQSYFRIEFRVIIFYLFPESEEFN